MDWSPSCSVTRADPTESSCGQEAEPADAREQPSRASPHLTANRPHLMTSDIARTTEPSPCHPLRPCLNHLRYAFSASTRG